MTLSRAKSITSDEAYTPYGVYRKAGEVGESVRYAPSMRCERIVLWRGSPRRAVASGFTHRAGAHINRFRLMVIHHAR
jgi:hypothetical protein